MKHTAIILLMLFSSLSFVNCKKKEPKPDLPPITTTGENTFGCYIDGEPYAIFDGNPNPWKITWTMFSNFSTDSMLFIETSHESPRWWFHIKIKNYLQKGAFYSKPYPFISTFMDYKEGGTMPTSSNLYETNNEHYLTVEITIANNKQYSGTFSGEMINEEGKVIKITEGRFDIKKNNP